MKKSKFLVALACFGLLVTGCNKPAESKGSQPTSTSGAASQPASTPASTPASSAAPTSSVAPVEDKYYLVPFGEGYETATKWEKGHEYKWTFKLTKNYKKVVFAFGAQMSSSSHGDRSLYTNHEGASSSDPFESNEANDGTCRITLKVNGVQQEVTHDTYEEAGLTNTEINYYKVAEFAVNAGDVEVSMTTHAQTGYRLMLGEEVRLYYKDSDESATPITPAFEGYKVTFSGEHCKVYVYDTKDYTKTPKETNSCIAKDEEGNIVAYDPEDEQLQPQVNFKVVCDEGYSLNASNFKITGKYNKLKQGPAEADGLPSEEYFRITKVQEDLAVVITPVQGTQAKGYKMTFTATNCSIKVYIGEKNADGTNLDTAEDGVYYARAKDSPYDISFASPQVNFEVVCNEGYEFKPAIDAEGKVTFITFTAAEGKIGYNKFKDNGNGLYNLTKIDSDLAIAITATEKAAEDIPAGATKVTKTVAELKAANNWENGGVVTSFTIGEIDVTVAGDAGDSKYYDSGSNIRIYVNKDNGVGSVALAAKSGYTILTAKFTYVWNKGTGTFPLASDTAGEVNAATISYAIGNPGAANEQLRISAFEFVYKAA